MKRSKLKLTLFLTVGFTLMSILGSLSIEGTRIAAANYLGYESHYNKVVGINLFSSDQIGIEFDAITRRGVTIDALKEVPEMKTLREKNQDNQAIIEASAMILVLILTVGGILLLTRGRTRNGEIMLSNWIGFFLSLVFVRYLVRYALTVYSKTMLCQEFSIFGSMGFKSFMPVYFLEGAGIILAIWIVFQIPKEFRLSTVIAGILGGFTGLILWMKFVGPAIGIFNT